MQTEGINNKSVCPVQLLKPGAYFQYLFYFARCKNWVEMKLKKVQFSHNQRGTFISNLVKVQDVNFKEMYQILVGMGALGYS